MKQLLFTKGPQGPIGATLGTAMNNFCSSSNKVSTHYITWLFSFWIWRRRCLKFAWFWPFGALPLGPHGDHTYYLNNFESPTPKDDSCQVWLKSNHAFSRRRWKCKKFTDDGRRTTHDGRKRTAIAHSSLRLRWAKKSISNSSLIISKYRQHLKTWVDGDSVPFLWQKQPNWRNSGASVTSPLRHLHFFSCLLCLFTYYWTKCSFYLRICFTIKIH